ncbi:hypothetical protein [Streptomyces sp. MUM 16J]|nr:hypothetical protein [Streptomyces sp. MUM 16J]MCH0561466.1 hypothetical protein [Streptomyces sp. MUM 16J]
MQRFYLFGYRGSELPEVEAALSGVLGGDFRHRNSSYKGGDYLLFSSAEVQEVTVERNWIDDEGYLAEPDFPEWQVLVYVTNPDNRTLAALQDVAILSQLRLTELD